MERERLTRLLGDPSLTTREDVAELRAMAERYPWFTGAQLLRAAGERAQGNVLADETLRVAAAHLPSRAALHDLVEREAAPPPLRVVRSIPVQRAEAPADLPDPVSAAPPAGPVVAEPAPRVEPVAERTEPEAQADPEVAVPLEEIVTPEPLQPEEDVLPGPVDLDEEPAVVTIPEADQAAIESARPAEDELDRQITQAALASAFDLTLLESLPEATPALTAPSAPTEVRPPAAHRAATHGRLSFTAWLDATEDAPPVAEPLAAVASSPLPLQPASNTGAEAPAPGAAGTAKPLAPAAANDLIDRFIRQQPPEIPPKPAFFTPQQAAKKSLDDSAGLVTETLARIYERQGNVAKAIEAYGRLALKYPEKSSYFAALQKKLEDQSNA